MVIEAKKTLILYTGGTIGMVSSDKGLVAASGFETHLKEFLQDCIEATTNLWQFHEVTPLIDSANITPHHWQTLTTLVIEAVQAKRCDSVLILHGTDTLAYSAAALSFSLLGLTVPILLTGSMLPAGVAQSDAKLNVCGAMRALSTGQVKGVQVYFHEQLLSGTRLLKQRSEGYGAFTVLPVLYPQPLLKELPSALCFAERSSLPSVIVLPIFPGITGQLLRNLMKQNLQGLVIECYGSGTVPSDNIDFMQNLAQLIEQGVAVVAISQCPEANVNFSGYAAAQVLQDVGVIEGGCLTREVALAKLNRLLGLGLSQQEVGYWFTRNLCGELGTL